MGINKEHIGEDGTVGYRKSMKTTICRYDRFHMSFFSFLWD